MQHPASSPARPRAFRAIVAGGGVAALEGALALTALAGHLVDVTLVTAATEYLHRTLPGAPPHDRESRAAYPIAQVVGSNVGLVREDIAEVDATRQTVTTTAGRQLPFDALLMATGTTPQVVHPYAITADDTVVDDLIARLLADTAAGLIHRVAFVTSTRAVSLLPLYEMVLIVSSLAKAEGIHLKTMLVTPEHRPLEVFGEAVSRGMTDILSDAGVSVHTRCRIDVPLRRQVVLRPGRPPRPVDRVIALPKLVGSTVDGLPFDADGFLPSDEMCRVPGTSNVYAAGDLTDHPVKHGGVAAQMAVVAARSIAASAGAAVVPAPLDVVLEAVLETGGAPRYLRAHRTGEPDAGSTFSTVPIDGSVTKITTTFLGARLDRLDGRA